MPPLINPLKKIWIGEACPPISFQMGRSELEANLRGKISTSFFGFGTRGLRGLVRNGRISVYWNTPGFGNAWRPVFHGTISGDDRESLVEGKFSTFRRTQVFCGVCFGGLALMAIIALPTVIGSIGALGMMALGTGLVAFGQYICRGEREKILSALGAIQNGNSEHLTETKSPGRGMKIVAAALAIGGIANLAGGIIALVKGGPARSVTTDFIFAFLILLIAWGVVKKRRYAWILGFVVILASAIGFVWDVSHSAPVQSGNDRVVVLVFSWVGASLVAIYWSVLWYGQRRYFDAEDKAAI